MCHLKPFVAGETLLEEGSSGLGLFIIVGGEVEVFKVVNGRRARLAILGEGDVVGEMALLDNQPRSASAVALRDSECLLLSRSRFRTLLERRARIAWPIVPALVHRIRNLQEQIVAAEGRANEDSETRVRAHPTRGETETEINAEMEVNAGRTNNYAPPDPEPNHGNGPGSDTAEQLPSAMAGILRAQYALMMTGATGFDESARLIEVFLRSLNEETGLTRGSPVERVARALPTGLVTASLRSWNAALGVPARMLTSFRSHLQAVDDEGPRSDEPCD